MDTQPYTRLTLYPIIHQLITVHIYYTLPYILLYSHILFFFSTYILVYHIILRTQECYPRREYWEAHFQRNPDTSSIRYSKIWLLQLHRVPGNTHNTMCPLNTQLILTHHYTYIIGYSTMRSREISDIHRYYGYQHSRTYYIVFLSLLTNERFKARLTMTSYLIYTIQFQCVFHKLLVSNVRLFPFLSYGAFIYDIQFTYVY